MKPKDQYWLLSTKEPEFTNNLIKIGVPENELQNWNFFDEEEDIFVFKIFNNEKENNENADPTPLILAIDGFSKPVFNELREKLNVNFIEINIEDDDEKNLIINKFREFQKTN